MSAPTLSTVSSTRCFGGYTKRLSHHSNVLGCDMKFAVYIPPQATEGVKCPVVYWLSGLTCTDENFTTKAGAQRVAAAKGLILVMPDTSPRGLNIEGEDETYDFGSGAGFYVNATEEKWRSYQMYAYVTEELPKIIESNFPVNGKESIFGHSMGGHGALICALKQPGRYKSVSAFAPICHPTECPWGQKAFTGYLGDNKELWKEYDAVHLAEKYAGPAVDILIDQGEEDNFLKDGQLDPWAFQRAAQKEGMALQLRMQSGYDHSMD